MKNTLHVTCDFCDISAMCLLLVDYVDFSAKGSV